MYANEHKKIIAALLRKAGKKEERGSLGSGRKQVLKRD